MTKLRYISLFSGIEAWSCAVARMPEYEAVAFSEVDPFACAVLAHHYPNVPNLGDITQVNWEEYRGLADIVVGGSPCQGFSQAGYRKGLRDSRSSLALAYVQAVEQVQPRWLLWENVPGVLSTNNGEDFRCFLAALDDLGFGLAWAVLDSQWFGVAQRRRRVFVVGRAGGWERATKVLFEPSCLQRHPPARRKAGEGNPRGASQGAGNGRVSGTLCASGAGLDRPSASGNQLDYCVVSAPASTDAGNVYPIDFKSYDSGGEAGAPAFTLRTDHPCAIATEGKRHVVRRIMPVEAERLQNFPDNYTNIIYNGRPAPDTLRYKALGNSMTVSVMRWLAERILEADKDGE